MCKREGIFFGILFLWLILIAVEVILFPVFASDSGQLVNLAPVLLLFAIIIPRYFCKQYNNWLESDLFKKK